MHMYKRVTYRFLSHVAFSTALTRNAAGFVTHCHTLIALCAGYMFHHCHSTCTGPVQHLIGDAAWSAAQLNRRRSLVGGARKVHLAGVRVVRQVGALVLQDLHVGLALHVDAALRVLQRLMRPGSLGLQRGRRGGG